MPSTLAPRTVADVRALVVAPGVATNGTTYGEGDTVSVDLGRMARHGGPREIPCVVVRVGTDGWVDVRGAERATGTVFPVRVERISHVH